MGDSRNEVRRSPVLGQAGVAQSGMAAGVNGPGKCQGSTPCLGYSEVAWMVSTQVQSVGKA